MVSRLAELKQPLVEHTSLLITAAAESGSKFMTLFFSDIELVKKQIDVVVHSTTRLGEIDSCQLVATTSEEEKALSDELAPLIQETNKKLNMVKILIKKLNDETIRMKSNKDAKQSEIRIRENLLQTISRKFVDVMKDYQSAQTKYKTNLKKKVKRHVLLVKPDATNDEIEIVFKSGGGADELFKGAVLKGDAADSIRTMADNVQDKYQDVLTLEASVAEVFYISNYPTNTN